MTDLRWVQCVRRPSHCKCPGWERQSSVCTCSQKPGKSMEPDSVMQGSFHVDGLSASKRTSLYPSLPSDKMVSAKTVVLANNPQIKDEQEERATREMTA